MLYDQKARKDGSVIGSIVGDDEGPADTDFVLQKMKIPMTHKKQIKRVVEYGPYIPILVRLLKEGHFD